MSVLLLVIIGRPMGIVTIEKIVLEEVLHALILIGSTDGLILCSLFYCLDQYIENKYINIYIC